MEDDLNRTESGQLSGEGPRLETFPLSFNQQSLLFMSSLDEAGTSNLAYNISFAAEIATFSSEAVDIKRLIQAMNMVLEKHDSLRTVFETKEDGKEGEGTATNNAQCVVKPLVFSLEDSHIDGSSWSEKELRAYFAEQIGKAFDLHRGPVIRFNVVTGVTGFKTVLFIVIHHIAVDLWSFEVLMRDLGEAWSLCSVTADGSGTQLGSLTLPQAKWHYCSFVEEQRIFVPGVRGESQWSYWRQQMKEPLPVLTLPLDRPRIANQSYAGSSYEFDLNTEMSSRLRALAKRSGATLFTLMLTAFNVLLHKYSDLQEDIIVGTPMACRNGIDAEKSVGYFVNPVPLRVNLSGNPSFDALVQRVNKTVVEAFDNQEFPFSELIRRLDLKGQDRSRSPLFDVMFILQKAHAGDTGGLEMFFLGKDKCSVDLGGDGVDG